MPNPAHAVVWPMPNHLLGDILKSWKGFAGREANRLLDRVGQGFWQPEPFNHWIRNDASCRYSFSRLSPFGPEVMVTREFFQHTCRSLAGNPRD